MERHLLFMDWKIIIFILWFSRIIESTVYMYICSLSIYISTYLSNYHSSIKRKKGKQFSLKNWSTKFWRFCKSQIFRVDQQAVDQGKHFSSSLKAVFWYNSLLRGGLSFSLRPSIDWLSPVYIMKGNLFYSKSNNLSINLI